MGLRRDSIMVSITGADGLRECIFLEDALIGGNAGVFELGVLLSRVEIVKFVSLVRFGALGEVLLNILLFLGLG